MGFYVGFHQINKNLPKTIWLMKRKKIYRLTCETARSFPIEKVLAKLGHAPTKSTEKEAWYLSPFRSETQASFKVSKELNRWYDHGLGKGGNVIDLVCLIKEWSVQETLEFLNKDQISFSFQQQPLIRIKTNTELKILYAGPIREWGLLKYLIERRISISKASTLCKEVHYLHKGRRYYAIGLENDSGGWELRNRYVKNCSSPKDITHLKNGNEKLILTEGMFDLLSLIEINPESNLEYDFLVLNSTAFVSKAIKVCKGYRQVELYLDNDTSGRKTTERLMECSKNCLDRSSLYCDFKDINEKIRKGFM